MLRELESALLPFYPILIPLTPNSTPIASSALYTEATQTSILEGSEPWITVSLASHGYCGRPFTVITAHGNTYQYPPEIL